MHFRPVTLLIAVSLTLFIPACSGGGSPSSLSGTRSCGSAGTNLLCLTACNLGCSLSGCSINKVAQNEQIELIFNQEIDKFSVPPYTTSILLRTASGQEPWGDWLVNGNRVTFVPGVLIAGAQTFFGFRPNETYTLYLPSGDDQTDVIRSMGGDRLSSTISCTLNVGEIRDLNGAPPSAKLVTPELTSGAELDTKIRIEFNEIIDPAIFVGTTIETRPIRFSVKSAETVNGVVVCQPNSKGIPLPGEPIMTIDSVRNISIVTFDPKGGIPGKKCVEIEVTSEVKDLAGVSATAHVLSFTTKDVGVQLESNREDFANSRFLDTETSAGTWGSGSLSFNPVGGSGRHGVFNPRDGEDISDPKVKVAVYLWDLDKPGGIKISRTETKSGKDEFVTDGRFEFSSMEVPDGVEVHFVGSQPARIRVRGEVRIGGLLASNGETIPVNGRPGWTGQEEVMGEAGGRGGAMAGDGGAGGDKCDNLGPKAAYNGKPGQDVKLLDGNHWYAGRFDSSGGSGSVMFPAAGNEASLVFGYQGVITQQANMGGGGGGFTSPGGNGYADWVGPNAANKQYLPSGTTAGGKGAAFPADFPNYTNGYTPADHFLVGGSGGGGGGSSVGGAIRTVPSNRWKIGRGGSGGGGAINIRAGLLTLLGSGRLECRGGDCPFDDSIFTNRGMMTPGGAGSGGSLFLQISGLTSNKGRISVGGGVGGQTIGGTSDTVYDGVRLYGGNGSNGILHFETVDPNNYPVGTTVPATPPINTIRSTDLDPVVAVRSLWYPASLLFPPTFLRYEIEAEIDGNPVLFSDDPAIGVLADVGQPLIFEVQGAVLEEDLSGNYNPIPLSTPTPVRKYVGAFEPGQPSLSTDGATGYRFELTLDRSLGKTVVVKAVTVFWEL